MISVQVFAEVDRMPAFIVTYPVKLLARVNGSPSWHIQSRSDGGRSLTAGRLRAVVRITY
jgi:hypothetical protein